MGNLNKVRVVNGIFVVNGNSLKVKDGILQDMKNNYCPIERWHRAEYAKSYSKYLKKK